MTNMRFLELLLLLLHHQAYSEEAEPTFRVEGSAIEMGYCFGVDYIVVYRASPEGDQLLGNSSADNAAITPPADLQGRVRISKHQQLLGLQIRHLTHADSGIYRRECWQNQALVNQHTQQLSVCDEEVESEEITVKEGGRGTELLCNSTSIGLEGSFVRWYHEMYPSYRLTLFLDSSVSLDPLVEELQGVVEVRDSGASLMLNNTVLKNIHYFYCLVIKGRHCLSFQTMHLSDDSESRDIFTSQGDRVVLNCPSDGNNQYWETPLGSINGSSVKNGLMYISFGVKSEDFSLIIPAASDEHRGDYSCISSSLEMQYSLLLCPKKETKEKLVFEGRDLLLECDIGEEDFQRVQWHRREPSGEDQLIHDSDDETVSVPEDLRGRLTLSNSSLTISHVEVQDLGLYWCVVSGGPEFLEDDDYKDDYDDEGTEEDELSDEHNFQDTHRCLFKQETILSLMKTTNGGVDSEPTEMIEGRGVIPTAEPASNVTAYAVGAGVVGLLVVGVIAAVIAIKRRAKASRSGLNTTTDIKMNADPGCTERLTHHEDCGA